MPRPGLQSDPVLPLTPRKQGTEEHGDRRPPQDRSGLVQSICNLARQRGLSGFFNQKMARDRRCEDKVTENVALVWVLLANQLKRDIYES